MDLDKIRIIKDFPKQGVDFMDITTVLEDAEAFQQAFGELLEQARLLKPEVVVALEARGYIFGPAMALALNVPFVPIRKKGKLPYKTFSADFALEYGTDTIEIHQDSIKEHQRVLVFDDVLATGGTAEAAATLVNHFNPKSVDFLFLIELSFLNGREKLKNYTVKSLIVK